MREGSGTPSAAFTPGPWEVYPQPIKGAGDAVLELVEQVQATSPIGDTLYLINADGKCPAVTGCGPTSEANARLIAAAPELYAALNAALTIMEVQWGKEAKPGSCIYMARAALAKARGES